MSHHTARSMVGVLALLVAPHVAPAQHSGSASPMVSAAPREALQFEFLVGQWELVAQPMASGLAARIHGVPKLRGTWKAWRAFDGWGIEDELRLTDESGNPRLLSHQMRIYDVTARRWNMSALDVFRTTFSMSTAEWRDGRMLVSARGTDQEGRAYVARIRFSDITPTRFRYQIDRSFDNEKSWTEGVMKIEAKRVAAVAPR